MQLVLLSEDPLDTHLVDGDGKTRYQIHTSEEAFTTITTEASSPPPVYTADGTAVYAIAQGIHIVVVGEFYWRSFSRNIMIFKGHEMPIKNYIKRNNICSSKFTFTAEDGRSYTWVTNHLGQLFLRRSNDPEKVIARFQRSTLGLMEGAFLDISPEGIPISDDIVVTFVHMCKLRKHKATAAAAAIEWMKS